MTVATPGGELPAIETEAATAVGRLARALVGRTLDPATIEAIAHQAGALADQAEASGQPRSKAAMYRQYTGTQRVAHFITTGEWPPPPSDGSELMFDPLSFVGGPLNPFSAGAVYSRDGDQAVARVRLDRCYEGPPTRAHGGILASVFDEVMGSVFRVLGIASAFTGSLTVRYEAPAPIDVELEFRARLTKTEGRKFTVEAEATGPDGRFAIATAIFIEIPPDQLALALAQDEDAISR